MERGREGERERGGWAEIQQFVLIEGWAEIQQFALIGLSRSLHSEACNAFGERERERACAGQRERGCKERGSEGEREGEGEGEGKGDLASAGRRSSSLLS